MIATVQSFSNSPKNIKNNQIYSKISLESNTKTEYKELLQIELKFVSKYNQGNFVSVSYT